MARAELELDSRPLVADYLRRFPPEVSELTFTNLFVWRGARPVSLAEIDGALVGGASLKVDEFIAITQAAAKA